MRPFEKLFGVVMRYVALIATCFAGGIFTGPSLAHATNSSCYAFAERHPMLQYVSLLPENIGAREVGVAYVGHSTFLIESAGGATIATDYAGYAGPQIIPEVVTMNRAHETHYTDYPDPAIEHVLRGWNPAGGAADHDIEVGDVRIRNVPTDIRSWGGVEPNGNSIFVFEVADLCIGHLGHLHHKPTDDQFAEIGFLDIVMAPVDGVYTMSQQDMIDTLMELRAQVVIPMHAFGPSTLSAFIAGMASVFEVEFAETSGVVFSSTALPSEPTILVLPAYSGGRRDD